MDALNLEFLPYLGGFAAFIGLLSKFGLGFFRTLDLHDKHFVRKPIARLRALRQAVSDDPALTAFFDQAIQTEAFRLATRIETSKAKRDVLLELDKKGIWSRAQLKSISKFLTMLPGQVRPTISITRADTVGAFISLTAALLTALAGVSQSFLLIITGLSSKPALILAGAGTLLLFLIAVRFFMTDFADWIIVKRAQKHLSDEG